VFIGQTIIPNMSKIVLVSVLILNIFLFFLIGCNSPSEGVSVWDREKAKQWYAEQGWLVGANFTPSTAINQIEFWVEETFDLETIKRELLYAREIGFNTARVYLHYLVWVSHPAGLKERMNKFLAVCEKHNIKIMFVLFDDCWNDNPTLGKQPEPKPGVHNSGWVQCPGGTKRLEDKSLYPVLEAYTKDIITHFADDNRIVVWDLFNEPGNFEHFSLSMPLLRSAFEWAREANPSQPISSSIWNWDEEYAELNEFILANSDIITFHHYNNQESLFEWIDKLEKYDRPMLCTEYMARTRDCTFESHLPVFKEKNIGAYNWGLVSGKTQTIYMWDSVYTAEPELWFHDIFRKDGTPFDENEINLIKSLTITN
jgi:hypothetical protein